MIELNYDLGEYAEDISDEIIEDLKEIMENIYELNVPLKVSIAKGKSWQKLK